MVDTSMVYVEQVPGVRPETTTCVACRAAGLLEGGHSDTFHAECHTCRLKGGKGGLVWRWSFSRSAACATMASIIWFWAS